jgi:isopentenyl diphosphate isomerase/L-lactate dehydrogenase-like FMN-dependent dehydrogenase
MRSSDTRNRRGFLKFLAGSPLLAGLTLDSWAQQPPALITDPKEAINVMDFEPMAHQALPPAHWGYLSTGVDDDLTIKANREGFQHIQLRPRRLVDVTRVDTRTELFGTTWDSPIFMCPVGGQRMVHPEGELAVARAAQSKRTLQILSTMTSTSVEDVIQARGGPVWYQLYPTSRWEVREKLVHRAEAAGCHPAGPGSLSQKPMFTGLDVAGVTVYDSGLNWESVRRLKKLTQMKLLLKGIQTAEDARLCKENGVDGIIVSNHGGRADETLRATIDCLPEVAEAAGSNVAVLVDGGFRRGTDVFKALALGARAVGIGRPYMWGLAAFGQPGVERVLDLMHAEFELVMKQCGTRSIAEIGRSSIVMSAAGKNLMGRNAAP